MKVLGISVVVRATDTLTSMSSDVEAGQLATPNDVPIQ